jgi:hypothetical protein
VRHRGGKIVGGVDTRAVRVPLVTLHEDEIQADEAVVRSLLREQRPEWSALPISPAGAGTDNTMYRLGDRLSVAAATLPP